jgi:hypothetical protein
VLALLFFVPEVRRGDGLVGFVGVALFCTVRQSVPGQVSPRSHLGYYCSVPFVVSSAVIFSWRRRIPNGLTPAQVYGVLPIAVGLLLPVALLIHGGYFTHHKRPHAPTMPPSFSLSLSFIVSVNYSLELQ